MKKKSRSILNSPRLDKLKKKRKKAIRNRILLYLLGIIIIISGLTYLSRLPELNINNTTVTGGKILDNEDINKVVNKDLSGRYFTLFPKTNFLLYPKNKIENDLKNTFKRIDTVSANIHGTKNLYIDLKERTADYIWCGDTPSPDVGGCYLMDNTGYIFDNAPYFSGNVYFRFFGNISGVQNDMVIGSYFNKNNFQRLLSFKDILKSMKLDVSSLFVKNDDYAEFYISSNIVPPEGPKIKIKVNDDLNKVAENLQAAIHTAPLSTNLENEPSKLSYIDLRFGNKVYFKFNE